MQADTVTQPRNLDPKRRYLCRHVHTDGRRCGSPSLRGQNFCYYHDRTRLPSAPLAGRIGIFRMQPIDDRAAIQIALYDILSRLTAGDINAKLASTVLYGLQIASSNLAFRDKQQPTTQPIETVTTDRYAGDLAPIQEIPESDAPPAPAAEPAPTPVTSAESELKSASAPPTDPAPAQPAPAAEPAPTPITSASFLCEPLSAAEPESAGDREEHLPLIPGMPVVGTGAPPLTLAAVQACAAQFTAVKPALAASCNAPLQTISTTAIPHPIRAVAAALVDSFTQAVSCRVSPDRYRPQSQSRRRTVCARTQIRSGSREIQWTRPIPTPKTRLSSDTSTPRTAPSARSTSSKMQASPQPTLA